MDEIDALTHALWRLTDRDLEGLQRGARHRHATRERDGRLGEAAWYAALHGVLDDHQQCRLGTRPIPTDADWRLRRAAAALSERELVGLMAQYRVAIEDVEATWGTSRPAFLHALHATLHRQLARSHRAERAIAVQPEAVIAVSVRSTMDPERVPEDGPVDRANGRTRRVRQRIAMTLGIAMIASGLLGGSLTLAAFDARAGGSAPGAAHARMHTMMGMMMGAGVADRMRAVLPNVEQMVDACGAAMSDMKPLILPR